ncbi:Lrp/AsnC family transcriptional regulator [Agrobacterium fabrum]|uniref:Lrp/AsnC family transcriptional regulator n=1 Tax=Agrobacterium fabrum TaxID=1176649 RepID=UPI001572C433|nr:Lrp/AsnC family transcriptional regulator [Agrobacterium fabrum]WCK80087.1 Lrp/AsnC family transcriptional regulator [Agrobacterium fabrum]
MSFDSIDYKILDALQGDGRMTVADLAEKVGLSASPAHRRQKLLEEGGIIEKYVAVVDPAKVGRPMQAYIFLGLEKHNEKVLADIEAKLMACFQVMECVLLAGEQDFMIHVACRDLADFEEFLRNHVRGIDGVREIRSSFRLRSMGDSRRVRFK